MTTEHREQAAVIDWARNHIGRYPWLEWLHSIPNGARLAGNAKRRAAQMNKLKAEGLVPGVPDLCLPNARGGYHGLYIEMKRDAKGKPSEGQQDWLEYLSGAGYFATVCGGADEAIETLGWYCELAATRPESEK